MEFLALYMEMGGIAAVGVGGGAEKGVCLPEGCIGGYGKCGFSL